MDNLQRRAEQARARELHRRRIRVPRLIGLGFIITAALMIALTTNEVIAMDVASVVVFLYSVVMLVFAMYWYRKERRDGNRNR
jgi:UDP-N-acetylmuramyl pentapeptide phosphotransferase/UDP-N-acetylglucosamine-1-phosphate transferase